VALATGPNDEEEVEEAATCTAGA